MRQAIYEKSFMLCGEGANGKSTLINVIKAFLGRENIASRALQDFGGDRFANADLYGKLANVSADLSPKKLDGTGYFKMLVSGDAITAQRKFGQSFQFENYAKLIFSTNQIPKTDDESYAFYRRWVIVPFTRVFEGSDADQHLLEKLTTPDELSGILNLALKGQKKLQQDRGFQDADLDEIKKQYELGASRIREFLAQECNIEPGNEAIFIESTKRREAYRNYCKAKGTRYFDERKFGEELKALGIVHKRKGGRKSRVWVDYGIELKSELDKELLRAIKAHAAPAWQDKSPIIKAIEERSTIEKGIIGDSPRHGGTDQQKTGQVEHGG